MLETPLSEQGFTNFATGAALAGRRPVVEFQIPFLLMLVFEQIANQANKFSIMSGGQARVPVTYLLPARRLAAGLGWAALRPAVRRCSCTRASRRSSRRRRPTRTGCCCRPSATTTRWWSSPRSPPSGSARILDYADLAPVPLGVGRVHRPGTDVTVVAIGHLVHDALAVAEQLAGEVSVEVFDPRTVYPFDWDGLAASIQRTGRLVVIDDANRSCGLAAEILATAAEEMALVAPPKRVTRPDGAVVGCSPELDVALQPSRDQLVAAIQAVMK